MFDSRFRLCHAPIATFALAALNFFAPAARAADHNDPNAINSIFADIPVNAADLYDMFGWPSDDRSGGEKVVLALTFAPVPATGLLDPDMLYRIRLEADPRPSKRAAKEDLEGFLAYAEALADKYVKLKAAEVRVKVDEAGQAHLDFIGFPSGDFSHTVATNQVAEVSAPGGEKLKVYVGGRDDAFFNDLPGFFRSINYAPQFYRVPHADVADRELKIPKTLIELEGNQLFNFDPARPNLGISEKVDLPDGPRTLAPDRFFKDAQGNFRFVYSGKDAQAGRNINAIVVEIPLAVITRQPAKERIVNAWGESWVKKAAGKIVTQPDDRGYKRPWWRRATSWDQELESYKLIDTDGVPFEDAALSEREDGRQLGANNLSLARHFVVRFGHLGWGFGPSVSALGLGTCFDHGDAPVSKVVFYTLATSAFPRVKKCFFQRLNMPDDSWNPKKLDIPLKRTFEIFLPNVNAIDMDTTGTWPYGRRLEDQVATRFLSTFLDMKTGCGGGPCHVESLGTQALWDSVKIVPKTPPNPLANDKPFLSQFPYLADPWP